MDQDHVTWAPWGITTLVSCLPVLVLGMGTALAHMLREDALDFGGVTREINHKGLRGREREAVMQAQSRFTVRDGSNVDRGRSRVCDVQAVFPEPAARATRSDAPFGRLK